MLCTKESEADMEIGPVECTVHLMQKFASDPEKQNEMKPDRICEMESNTLDGTMERIPYILDGLDDKFYKTVEFGDKITIQKAIVSDNTLTVLPYVVRCQQPYLKERIKRLAEDLLRPVRQAFS